MGTWKTHWMQRFWEKVEITDGCWNWQGAVGWEGYGVVVLPSGSPSRTTSAHRAAWELYYGQIPEGLCVCHTCDNVKCVRKDHLWIGSRADNNKDRMLKGRNRGQTGSKHPRTRFTEAQVLEIREAVKVGGFGAASRLARQHGVDVTTISAIVRRRSWTHI